MSENVLTLREMDFRTKRHMLRTMLWRQGSCFVQLVYQQSFTVIFATNTAGYSFRSWRKSLRYKFMHIPLIVRYAIRFTNFVLLAPLIAYQLPQTHLSCAYLTATAALGALYYYVLAHQADFDVCWCKGSVAEVTFKTWLELIKSPGCQVLGNNRVVDVLHEVESNKVTGMVASKSCGTYLFSDHLLVSPQIM